MKRKVKKYLSGKDKSKYDNLDRILEMYINGEIKAVLSKYARASIYPSFVKDSRALQLNYNFNNIYVTVDFFEDKYNVLIYHSGVSADDLEKLSVEYLYQDNFDLDTLIAEIDLKIKDHPKLKDTTLVEKKKKVYSLISWVSLCLPVIIYGGIGLYCIITESAVQLDMWSLLFMVVAVVVWFVFDVKSKRLK